jgi:hypothetical protein
MTASTRPDIPQGASPRAKARMAGTLFLLTIILGIIAESVISGRLVVTGDAAATAANITANNSLFRLAFAIYLVEMTCQIAMTSLFYDLLKPVDRGLSAMAAALSYIGCGIKAFSRLFFFAPLLVLGGAQYLAVFDAAQLQALALLFLRLNSYGAGVALVFFGFYGLIKGYLVFKSGFLPRALGVLTLAGGIGWLTFLSPALGLRLFPFVALVALIGSLATIVWLLVFGVNQERWLARAAAARSSPW